MYFVGIVAVRSEFKLSGSGSSNKSGSNHAAAAIITHGGAPPPGSPPPPLPAFLPGIREAAVSMNMERFPRKSVLIPGIRLIERATAGPRAPGSGPRRSHPFTLSDPIKPAEELLFIPINYIFR